MIESGFLYLGVIIGLAGLVAFLESSKSKFFKFVPGIVLIYFGGAILKTTGVIGSTETIDSTYGNVRDVLLPMLIFLMLINCDLRKLKKLAEDAYRLFHCSLQYHARVRRYLSSVSGIICGEYMAGIRSACRKLDGRVRQYGDYPGHTRCT